MSTITIRGEFLNSDNNWLTLDVYVPNSSGNPYNLTRTYHGSFVEELSGLENDAIYYIDFAGYTTGTVNLTISGEFKLPNPIHETITETGFSRGYTIQTNK